MIVVNIYEFLRRWPLHCFLWKN